MVRKIIIILNNYYLTLCHSLLSAERHHLDTIGRFPMIVMEYIDGGSLRSVLNKFRVSELDKCISYFSCCNYYKFK